MKTILLFSILFCVIAMPALGELTDADLNKIRLIVQEEIQEELKPIKAEIVSIKAEIVSIKAEIGTLKTDGAVVKTELKNLKETVKTDFGTIQKNFDRQNNIIIACIGIPMAILAIGATVWGILANRRSPKVNEQREQIAELTREDMEKLFSELTLKDKRVVEQLIRDQEQKIEALTQEIETLKQQPTVNP